MAHPVRYLYIIARRGEELHALLQRLPRSDGGPRTTEARQRDGFRTHTHTHKIPINLCSTAELCFVFKAPRALSKSDASRSGTSALFETDTITRKGYYIQLTAVGASPCVGGCVGGWVGGCVWLGCGGFMHTSSASAFLDSVLHFLKCRTDEEPDSHSSLRTKTGRKKENTQTCTKCI